MQRLAASKRTYTEQLDHYSEPDAQAPKRRLASKRRFALHSTTLSGTLKSASEQQAS